MSGISPHIPIWINGRAIPLSALGDIGKLPIDEALQAMLDQGWFGVYPSGTHWSEVFRDVNIKAVAHEELRYDPRELYQPVIEALDNFDAAEAAGAHEDELHELAITAQQALTTYELMVKLSND